MEQLPLPFNYATYIVAKSVYSNPNLTADYLAVSGKETVKEVMRLHRLTWTNEAIDAAISFIDNEKYIYRHRSVIEQQISALLNNPEYFPENINDYVKETQNVESACYHQASSKFWRDQVTHIEGRKTLFSLAGVYGGMNNFPITQDSDFPCLYHRGMDVLKVDPVIRTIVQTYDYLKDYLGEIVLHDYVGEEGSLLHTGLIITTAPDNSVATVSLGTLVGRIWLEGTPEENRFGGNELHSVH